MKILTKRLEKFPTVKNWRLNWITSLCKYILCTIPCKDVNVTYLSEAVVFEIN